MKNYSIAVPLLITCLGCASTKAPADKWTYSESKSYPGGVTVAAVIKAEMWAADEPPRLTRDYAITVDGRTVPLSGFKGEINRVFRNDRIVIAAAYCEFAIRSVDGDWSYVAACSTAELHQQGVPFAADHADLVDKWKWLEIENVDLNHGIIELRDRDEKTPYQIGFDDAGRNLEFR
jgi:hypothetical protein